MNYLQKKKLAFMSIVNRVKGFVRTVTGTLPLMLEGCVDEESIIDYTLYGQSVQNGTPTPETPIEVESVGEYDEIIGKYKIPIKVSGKNLLSPQKWVSGEHSDGIVAYPNVNYITSIGENYIEANLAAWRGVASEKFEYAKVNTVGFKINKNQVVDDYIIYYIGLQGYDVDGKKTVFKQLSTSVVADKEYVFKKNNGNFVFGLSTTSVRLCILSRSQAITGLRVYDFYSTNDAETGYEPYHEPITTNIYLDEPLRKVPDSDRLYYENQICARRVKEYICKGNEGWYKNGEKDGLVRYVLGGIIPVGTAGRRSILTNMYPQTNSHSSDWWQLNTVQAWGFTTQPGWIGVCVSIEDFPTVTDFKNFVATKYSEGNPLKMYFGISATETPITLPPIPTFKGTSIISADTTIQPSNVEITYYSNVKE